MNDKNSRGGFKIRRILKAPPPPCILLLFSLYLYVKNMKGFRKERIAQLIQEKIGAMLVSGRVKDPRVDGLATITRVEVSNDLAWADVYVSSLNTASFLDENTDAKGDETAVEEAAGQRRGRGGIIAGLQSAAPFIQSELAKGMHTRLTPRLRFHRDTGLREEFDIIKRLEAL
jgi:ribosome-binding factor A